MASMTRSIKRSMYFSGLNKQQKKLIKREGLTWSELQTMKKDKKEDE